MVSSKHFLCIMLWDHPIETTIYKQMAIRFQVFPPKSTFAYIDLYQKKHTRTHSNFDLAQPPNMRWSFKQDWDRLLSGCFILTQLCFSDHEMLDSEVLPKMTWRKSSKKEDFLGLGVFKTCVPVWSLPFLPLVQRNMTLQNETGLGTKPYSNFDGSFNEEYPVSHEKNRALLSIESWLFSKDPYNGSLCNPHIAV